MWRPPLSWGLGCCCHQHGHYSWPRSQPCLPLGVPQHPRRPQVECVCTLCGQATCLVCTLPPWGRAPVCIPCTCCASPADCLLRFHFKNISVKVKSLSISRWWQQNIKPNALCNCPGHTPVTSLMTAWRPGRQTERGVVSLRSQGGWQGRPSSSCF